MRPLSGRILVPVVISVALVALTVTGLLVWAKPGVTIVPGVPTNPAGANSSNGTSGNWTFRVTYTDVNPDPGGETPDSAQYTVVNMTTGTTLVAWTDLPAGTGSAPTGIVYTVPVNIPLATGGGVVRITYRFVDSTGETIVPDTSQNIDVNNPPNTPAEPSMTPPPGTGTGTVAGTNNTTYTFFVTSPTDPDSRDTDPYTVTVWLHLGGLGEIQMQPVDGIVGANKTYFAVVHRDTVAGFDTGNWPWYVDARDTRTHDNTSERAAGPTFTVVDSQRETLSFNNNSADNRDWSLYINPDDTGLSHGTGSSSSTYVFHVQYRHPEGLPPRPFYTTAADVWGNAQAGVVVWLPNPHNSPPFTWPTDYQPHHMVWDAERNGKDFGAATHDDYAAGVWFKVTVDPQANGGGTYFTPNGVGDGPGYVDNNYFTDFSSWDVFSAFPVWTPPWSYPSQGLLKGTIPYRFQTTSDYRPNNANYTYPSGAHPAGQDRAGEDPAAYLTTTASGPDFTLYPLLARGGRVNDVLDTTPSWQPETFHGTPNLPGFDYWPLINQNHSRSPSWMTWDFYVKYYGPNDNPPVYVAVYLLKDPTQYGNPAYWRNPANYDYHQMVRDDTSHAPGIWYKYTTTLNPGVTRFWFKAFDGEHEVYYPRDPRTNGGLLDLTCGDTYTPNAINNRPTLSAASVSPATAPEGSTTPFTYKVTYTDTDRVIAPNGDPPRYAFVDIYDPLLQPAQDAGGNAIPGTVTARNGNSLTFNFVNKTAPSPLSLYQGWYVKMINGAVGPNASSRGHYFRIASVTGTGPYVINVDQSVVEDDVTKRSPQADGVEVGDQFIIVYRGTMQPVNAGDTNYTDGAEFQFVFNQFYANQPRTFRYAFTFADNWGVSAQYGPPPGELGEFVNLPAGDRFGVESSYNAGPVLTAANPAGQLTAPAVSPITPDPLPDTLRTVDPNAGTSATLFRFRIKYTHPNGLPPQQFIRVAISNSATGWASPFNPATAVYGPFAITADLTEHDGADIKQGRTYWTDLRLPAVTDIHGYAFKFEANDGIRDAQLGPTSFPADSTGAQGCFGPVVHPNRAPVLSAPSVTWEPNPGDPANLESTITYRVTYSDADNYAGVKGNPPTELWLYIDGYADANRINMLDMSDNPATVEAAGPVDPNDTDFTNGAQYYVTLKPGTLALGAHKYFFLASDGADSARLPASDFRNGPTIQDRAPTLTNASSRTVVPTANQFLDTAATPDLIVAPNGTAFHIEVMYRDLDGDAPTTMKAYVLTPGAANATAYAFTIPALTADQWKAGHVFGMDLPAFTVPGIYQVTFECNNAQHPTLIKTVWTDTEPSPRIETNVKPNQPVLVSPANHATISNPRPQLQWTPASPQGDNNTYDEDDSLVYVIQMDTASTFNSGAGGTPLRSYGPTAAGATSWDVPTDLTPGLWYWRVAARDEQGLQSDWSAVWDFTYQPNRPPVWTDPVTLAPTGGEIVSTLQPTLSWDRASDPDVSDTPDTLIYTVQVALFADATYTNPVAFSNSTVTGVATPTVSTVVNVDLTEDAHYRWRVSVRDPGGLPAVPDWREGDFWVNATNSAPSAPALSSPANDTTITTLTPTLQWNAASPADPDPGTTAADISYEIRIADNNNGNNPDTWTNPQDFAVGAGVEQFVVPAGLLRVGAPFFWAVRAVDPGRPPLAPNPAVPLRSPWSATRQFRVSNDHAPWTPVEPFSPSGPNVYSTELRPMLSWTPATPVDPDPGDTVTYEVQLCENSSFTGPSLRQRDVTDGTSNTVFPFDLTNGTRYYWRVRAVDQSGLKSDWTAAQSFWSISENRPPNPVTAGFSAGDAAALRSGQGVVLRWTASTDPDNPPVTIDLVHYIVQLSQDPAMAAGNIRYQYTTADQVNTQTIPAGVTLDVGDWYWRVQAVDSLGARSAWSAIQKFTIEPNVAPNAVSGVRRVDGYAPADFTPAGIRITNATPRLSWNAATDPNTYDPPETLRYQVQVAASNTFSGPLAVNVTTAAGVTQYQLTEAQALAVGTWYWRVRTQDAQGAFAAWSASQPFVVEANQPPNAPTIVAPRNRVVVASSQPTLSWSMPAPPDPNPTDPLSTLRYQVEVANDAGFTGIVWSTTTAVNPVPRQVTVDVPLAENGHFWWRVAGIDDENAQGAWSAAGEFYVNASSEAPVAPNSGFVPANNGEVNTLTPTLQWNPGTDPDPGTTAADLHYQLVVADNAGFVKPVITAAEAVTAAGVTQYTIPAGRLRWGVNFWWRVATIDQFGRISAWSVARQFLVTGNLAPNPPTAGFDPTGAIPVQQLRPTLRWNAATDPNPADTAATLRYEVQLADNLSWTSPLLYNMNTAAGVTNAVVPADLPNGKHLYWRVRTVDAGGLKSDWSAVQDFWSISQDRPPAQVTSGFDPQMGKVFSSGNIGSLRWDAVQDPDNPPVTGDLVHYIVQLSQDPAMAAGNIRYQYTTANEVTTQPVPETLAAGDWYWRVQAVDTLGLAAPWSTILRFTVELNVPPNAVSGGYKVDGYVPADFTPAGIVISNFQPLLSWGAASDPNTYDPPSTLAYRVQVSATLNFASPVRDVTTAKGGTKFQLGAPLAAGTWYWRVQTLDSQGATSPWSAPQAFVIQGNRAPSAPTNLVPRGNVVLAQNQPVLQWEASVDPDPTDPPSTLVYRVQVATNPAFGPTDRVFETTTSGGVTQATVSPALAENAHLWWRVRAIDNENAHSPWSDIVGFYVNLANEAPLAPVSGFTPPDGAQIPTLTPTLSWNAGSDPDPGDTPATLHYEVRIADNATFTNPQQGVTLAGVTQFQVATALREGVLWYWQVRTVDRGGLRSPWSATQSLYARGNAAPGAPVAPFDPAEPRGAQPPTPVQTAQPTLSWGAATDPDAAAGFDTPDKLRYQVQTTSEKAFLAKGFGGALISDQFSAAGQTQVKLNANLPDNYKCYWRVRTQDTAGAFSDWSPAMFFWVNLVNNPPNPPVGGFSPTNSEVVNTQTPTLRWDKATDPDPDDPKPGVPGSELGYVVQVSLNANFTTPVYQFTVGRGVTQVTTTPLADNNTWFWRVQSVDDDNAVSAWSVTQRFALDTNNQPPTLDITGLNAVSPARGTTGDNYEYQVRYTDPEGDAPTAVTLEIDGATRVVMHPQDPTAPNYQAGVVFVVTVPGTQLGVGNHTFRFLTDREVVSPVTGSHSGPLIGLFSISGRVADINGTGLAGVTINATGGLRAVTAADGTYTLPNLRSGTYTLTPVLVEYTFSPTNRSVTVNATTGDVSGVNFTATRRTYTISGRVTDATSGAGIAGVQVTAGTQSAVTAADGTYTISGLLAGSYTVTPTRAEYLFTPTNRTVSVSQSRGNVGSVNYTGTQRRYTIAGWVRLATGLPVPGARVAMGAASVTTDANGRYVFERLLAGTYTVTPSGKEYQFEPPSRTVTVNEANGSATDESFVASRRTYSVSGTVTAGGNPLAGVRVQLGSQETTTAADGTYAFTGLLAGRYTVTPSLAETVFTPTSRTVTVDETEGSKTGVDFVANTRLYGISGTITDSGGVGLEGVQVRVGTRTVPTHADGKYAIGSLPAGTYTVTPVLAEWSFTPASRNVTVNQTTGHATNIDFTAARKTYTISGRITTGAGTGLAGVTVTAGDKAAVTAADGNYTITGLLAGAYTVRPTLAEYMFTPATRNVTVNETTGNVGSVNFSTSRRTYSISGRVLTATGQALTSVLISLGAQSVLTDGQGRYTLSDLPAGAYTITPSLSEHTFAPANRVVNVNETTGSATNQDFTATRKTYTISGLTVTGTGVAIGGVQVSADGHTVNSAADGTYQITGLPAGTYTVTPFKPEVTFAPSSTDVTVNETVGSKADVNFTGSTSLYSISGSVATETGAPVAGVLITAGARTVTTGADGRYTLSGLPAGVYDLVPSRTEYSFSPTHLLVTVNYTTGNVTGQRFTGMPNTYTVSGEIKTSGGVAIPGVQVAVGGRYGSTGEDGRYTVTGVPAGTWTVTPYIDGYTFTPASRSVTVNLTVGNATGINFTGSAVFVGSLAVGANLITVPCTPVGDTSPAAVFGTTQVTRITGEGGAVSAQSLDADYLAVAPGKAYLVQSATRREITVSGTPAPADQPFRFTLQAGWNLIGNPWDAPLPFANLTAASADLATTGQVYDPETGSYLIISDRAGVGVARTVIAPWEAVWVKANRALTLAVAPPAPEAATAEPVAPQALKLGEGGWAVPITVSARGRADLTTVAGVSSNGAKYVVDNAPALPGSVDAYLVGAQEARLAQLIQPAVAGAVKWDFVVTTDLKRAEIVVNLPDLSAVPNDLSVTLSDLDSGREVYARTTSRYTFTSSAEGVTVRHFRLTVAPRGQGGLVVTAVTAQQQAGAMVLTYSISGPCQVTARVLNIAGRTVKTLVADQVVSAGTNTIPWNLRNDSGSLVPAGAYLIRLEAVAADGQRVSTVCPAQVVR